MDDNSTHEPSDHHWRVGVIDEDWLSAALSNQSDGETVEDWIVRATNSTRVCLVNENRGPWLRGPGAGRWLTQDEVDAVCTLIDRGA